MHCSPCHWKWLQTSPLNWRITPATAFCFLFRPFHYLFDGVSGIRVPFETSNPHLIRCCVYCPVHLHRSRENRTKAGCSSRQGNGERGADAGRWGWGGSTKLAGQRALQKTEGPGCHLPVCFFCIFWSRVFQWTVRPEEMVFASRCSSLCLTPVFAYAFLCSLLLPLPSLCVDGWMDEWFLTLVLYVSVSVCPSLFVSLSLSLSDSKILSDSVITVNSNHLSLEFGHDTFGGHSLSWLLALQLLCWRCRLKPGLIVTSFQNHQLTTFLAHCLIGVTYPWWKAKDRDQSHSHFPLCLIKYHLSHSPPVLEWDLRYPSG